MFYKFLDDLNFISRCKKYNIGLWQCPNFLFVVMAFTTIVAMLGTAFVAQRYDDETVTIFSVTGVTVFILTIGGFVIRGVEKIAEANIIKTEFISIISHQLCSPLSSIKWNLEIIETEKLSEHALTEKQQLFLDNIKKSNEKMLKLVTDLTEVVRVDQGRAVFMKENIGLAPLVAEVIQDLEYLRASKKVEVENKFDEDIPQVYADAKKMKIAIENLISNAIKYSHDGGKIEVSLKRKGKRVFFTVQDWGVGIPQYQHGKVFEKFFRTNNTSKYRTEGVGLGLYLARSILKNFDGEVWFESIANQGSTFYVSLPAAA